ncbi:MAG TPA: tripartite tricarboxylate transporter substrate binding protein [Burkholderiales bacterium]|nr:tripartite tricarboxylate transporter substrate binding protein [Burkholderiales bacterium]
MRELPGSAAGKKRAAAKAVVALWLAALAATQAAGAPPREFPSRPLRVIVPFPPGGGADIIARILAGRLAELAGQFVVVDNRPGASGTIGTELAARATPDGHTVVFASLSLVVSPALFGSLNYDVLKDFAPVSLLASAPFALVVHPSVPAATVKDLIAYARPRPNELNYASAGSGTNLHVAAELFKLLGRVDIVHVPYKGSGLALAALLGGETHLGFLGVMTVVQHVRTGRLRALGVTGPKRTPALPEVPTVAEAGVPGYEFTSWYGVLAPAATPEVRVIALNGHLRNTLLAPDVAERLGKDGAEIIASSPREFGRHLRAELAKWAKVVKQAGLRPD